MLNKILNAIREPGIELTILKMYSIQLDSQNLQLINQVSVVLHKTHQCSSYNLAIFRRETIYAITKLYYCYRNNNLEPFILL